MRFKSMFYITDASHGWVKASRLLVKEFGIKPSGYSYFDDHFIYLEEDLDAPLLIEALHRAGYMVDLIVVDDGDRSPIRDLPRIMEVSL